MSDAAGYSALSVVAFGDVVHQTQNILLNVRCQLHMKPVSGKKRTFDKIGTYMFIGTIKCSAVCQDLFQSWERTFHRISLFLKAGIHRNPRPLTLTGIFCASNTAISYGESTPFLQENAVICKALVVLRGPAPNHHLRKVDEVTSPVIGHLLTERSGLKTGRRLASVRLGASLLSDVIHGQLPCGVSDKADLKPSHAISSSPSPKTEVSTNDASYLVKSYRVLDAEEHRHPVFPQIAETIRHTANPRGFVVSKRPSIVPPKLSRAFLSAVRALQVVLPSVLRSHQAIPTLEIRQ